MDDIRAGVSARGWGDRLLPLLVVSTEDLEEDPQAEARLEELKRRAHCGTQYVFLARYALQRLDGRLLDLSVHVDDRAEVFIRPAAVAAPDGEGFVLGETDDDALRLFAPFRFPLLDLTKEDMGAVARELGFKDLLGRTWFCHNPVRREGRLSAPCGVCQPCRYTHEEGMGHRIGLRGHVRRIARDRFGPLARGVVSLRSRLGVGGG